MRSWCFGFLVFLGLASLGAQTPATHTVQKGETVYAIAKQYGTTTDAILKTNPDLNPSRIHAGDKIRLPNAKPPSPPASAANPAVSTNPSVTSTAKPREWVRVQKGDTLSKIARQEGIPLQDLRKWNRIDGNTIRPGDLLRLRAASTNPTTSATHAKPPKTDLPKAPPPRQPAEPDDRFIAPVRRQIDAPKDRLRDWEYIVVHHSGTSGGNAKIFDYYHSEERGMENGMAYHFVIGNGTDSGDGQIEVGRRWLQQLQGGHLASETLNEISIGICLVGDFSRNRLGPRQTASLIELVQYLRKLVPENHLKFRLHREINTRPTECPGRLFPGKALHEILR